MEGEELVKNLHIDFLENNKNTDQSSIAIYNSLDNNSFSFKSYLKQLIHNEETRFKQQQSFLEQLHYFKDLCFQEKSLYAELKQLKNQNSPGINLL